MANRETQVDIVAIVTGSPKVRATQVGMVSIQGANPHGKITQISLVTIVPNIPNAVPPGGPLSPIQELLMP